MANVPLGPRGTCTPVWEPLSQYERVVLAGGTLTSNAIAMQREVRAQRKFGGDVTAL